MSLVVCQKKPPDNLVLAHVAECVRILELSAHGKLGEGSVHRVSAWGGVPNRHPRHRPHCPAPAPRARALPSLMFLEWGLHQVIRESNRTSVSLAALEARLRNPQIPQRSRARCFHPLSSL